METIYLERLYIDGIKCIRLNFNNAKNTKLHDIGRNLSGSKWSRNYKCWYIENTPGNITMIEEAFDGVALVDRSRLFQGGRLVDSKQNPGHRNTDHASFGDTHEKVIDKFIYYLRDKRYSERTVAVYVKAIQVFLAYHEGRDIATISNDDIVVFNNKYVLARKLSASFQNQIINSIKLFYRVVHNVILEPNLIKRPKTPRRLPNVLSMDEVTIILNGVRNLKHRTMLAMIYGCGLRRSEVLDLQLRDVDSSRMMLKIRNGKGMKDRMVPLSKNNLAMLKEYYIAFRPGHYLFEGIGGKRYGERSLQNVFKQALLRTNIRKPATLHWLRHSYATHLLEHGTDIRIIQELLGHKSTKTTMIYTHVSRATLNSIKSPIDRLDLSGESDIFNQPL